MPRRLRYRWTPGWSFWWAARWTQSSLGRSGLCCVLPLPWWGKPEGGIIQTFDIMSKRDRMGWNFVFVGMHSHQSTGSSRSPDAKWLLIASKIWVPVTSWVYWGLTRCCPFAKICLSSFWVPFGSFYRAPHKDINHIDQLNEKLLGTL